MGLSALSFREPAMVMKMMIMMVTRKRRRIVMLVLD